MEEVTLLAHFEAADVEVPPVIRPQFEHRSHEAAFSMVAVREMQIGPLTEGEIMDDSVSTWGRLTLTVCADPHLTSKKLHCLSLGSEQV